MVELNRYEIRCMFFPDNRMPFDKTFIYFSITSEKEQALQEFYKKLEQTDIWYKDVISKDFPRITDPSLEKIVELVNDPLVLFARKEDVQKRFPLQEGTTQAFVCADEVYVWEGDRMQRFGSK